MKNDFQICSLIWRPEHCFYHWFCRKCAEQKLHSLSYADGDMDSQCQQDQHKSQYVPHIICDSGLGAKMSVLFACLIKRVSKLPLYQLVIILSSADVLCKQFGRPPVKYFTDRPKAVLLLWIFYVFFVFRLLCLCARLFMCALWSPAEKGLTSWLSFVGGTDKSPLGQKPTRTRAHWTKAHCSIWQGGQKPTSLKKIG